MQRSASNSPDLNPASKFLNDLIQRYTTEWEQTRTSSLQHPTSSAAFSHIVTQHPWRMRHISNIVMLGWRNPGRAIRWNSNNGQGLTEAQKHIQKVTITQLAIARMIQNMIRVNLGNNAPVNLYICDQDYSGLSFHQGFPPDTPRRISSNTKARLQDLQLSVISKDDLPNHTNQNSLIYDVTMAPGVLHTEVNFDWDPFGAPPPAAVITHMENVTLQRVLDE